MLYYNNYNANNQRFIKNNNKMETTTSIIIKEGPITHFMRTPTGSMYQHLHKLWILGFQNF
jgi:hypothetical protein